MPNLQIYDPPMCCSTGVCGPQVDPALVRFSADLDWLKGRGVGVERFNLSQSPAAFVANATVTAAMRERDDALPLVLVDGRIVAQGSYPDREALAGFVGIEDVTVEGGTSCCPPAAPGTPITLLTGAAPKKCC